jgi:quercetin dioxygenase-like cupin family protein
MNLLRCSIGRMSDVMTFSLLLLVWGCASPQPSTSVVDVPDKLKIGAGESLTMIVPAKGVQIYDCRASKDQPEGYEWAHRFADSDLFDQRGNRIGRHAGGPYWESTDGSKLVGKLNARVQAPVTDAVPWLLLAVKSVGSEGSFSKVTSIQRVNTVGGAAPKSGCAKATAGTAARIPFTADYYFFTASTTAQPRFVIKPVAEKKLKQLPPGSLYWRVENLPTLAQAQAAAGPTSLAVEVAGKVWLFTLGPSGGSTSGASKVVEIGPVPPISAPEYLLRIINVGGPPGVNTRVHTHPGSETFYVLTGRLGQRTSHGVSHVEAGGVMNGHGADMPMEVSSSGTSDLNALVMFVVDATRPFSSPAKLL